MNGGDWGDLKIGVNGVKGVKGVNVIYKIGCKKCRSFVYIGETERRFCDRLLNQWLRRKLGDQIFLPLTLPLFFGHLLGRIFGSQKEKVQFMHFLFRQGG